MTTDSPLGRRTRLQQSLDTFGPFIGLSVVVILFAIIAPSGFLSLYNAKTVATQTVIVGLSAIGMVFVIRSGGIDLSVGSTIALASVATALGMKAGYGELASAAIGITTGALVGVVNGGLITRLALPPFIVTLGTLGAARGVAKWLGDEQKVDAPSGWLQDAMSKSAETSFLGLAPGVWLMIVCALGAAVLLRITVFGTWTTAIGSNEPTARLCGVPVERMKLGIYVLCGAAAGLAGVLQFGRLTVGDPTTAMGKELDVIAAVVIGGASLSGGTGTILGAMIGAFLMATLANVCNLTGIPNYVQEILIGAIIVGAVALDGLRAKARASAQS
ncbi:MAG: ribose/xylose/arabinose/galactoside ABC-type transport system permease subunit [Planctomycetota bacterium]|jgi:ribose/xylose/arabinose/galactoside ABC-type transport system permease subunit